MGMKDKRWRGNSIIHAEWGKYKWLSYKRLGQLFTMILQYWENETYELTDDEEVNTAFMECKKQIDYDFTHPEEYGMESCDNCYHVDFCVPRKERGEKTMCEKEEMDCFMSWERADELVKECIEEYSEKQGELRN